MKLTVLFLTVGFLNVCATGVSQNINFSGDSVSLESVISSVEKQTGFVFLYTEPVLRASRPVSIRANNVPVNQFLSDVFKSQPLEYALRGKSIFISRRTEAPFPFTPPDSSRSHSALSVPLTGRVVDEEGQPLAGAFVSIKNGRMVTITDAQGIFTLNVTEGDVLIVTYVERQDREVRVTASMLSSGNILKVMLSKSVSLLDDAVVIAYGTTSRRFNVGTISTIDAATIEKQPVTNVLLALQGQAPGLAINATSGVPGSQVLVQVRGQNTLMSDGAGFRPRPYDQPLFIVDGVPFAANNNIINQLSSLASAQSYSGGVSQRGGISPLNNINPADIESVTVLKDADATSIYGTQGSNGVILITTKKGKAGKTSFNVNVNTGFNTPTRQIPLMNTQQYLQLRREAYAVDSIDPSTDFYNAPDLNVFDQNKYTDWQKLIYGKTSNNTDVHASLSGGNVNNVFLLSAGYTKSDFNFPGSYSDQRFTIHSSFHHSSSDNRLSIDFGTDFGYERNNSPGFVSGSSINLAPNTPDLLDSAGNLLWAYKGVDLGSYQFYSYLKQSVDLNTYNLNNSLRISYRILPGLSLSANLGYGRNMTDENAKRPKVSQAPSFANASADFANNVFQTLNVEPQLDYTYTTGKGMLTTLVGASYKKNTNKSTNIRASGYANDNFLGSINGASSISATDASNIYKYVAVFARIKYIYDQKYIVNLTGRRDGSSSFGPGNQFGNFGSVGAGWIFSEEDWFKRSIPFISFGKLSANYGTSGSDGADAYQYQAFWSPIYYVPSFQGIQPSAPGNLYNPNYSWALKKSTNISMDLGFFHDRLFVNVTHYINREGSQLAGYPLAGQTGFASVLQNIPANVQNKGWEFSVSSTNIKTETFSWLSNFNISFNRNRLLSFPNLESSSYKTTYVVGQPISTIFGFRYKGVNPATGLLEYYTAKGEPTSQPNYSLATSGGDYVPIANREVKYMGGFGNTFSYKRLSLYVFVQFASQTAPNYLSAIYGSGGPGYSAKNLPVAALDYWKKPGDITAFGKLTASYSGTYQAMSYFNQSSGAFSDDTFARLKTVALSYSFPETWLKKIRMQDLRAFVNAQNIATVSNYKIGDPELFSNYTAVPLQRIVSLGLSFNF